MGELPREGHASEDTAPGDSASTGWSVAAGGAWVSAQAEVEDGVALAPGAVVHPGVTIASGSVIGAAAVVHERTRIAEDCVIEDHAVLGKRPRLRPGSSAAASTVDDLELGPGVTVCCGAVVYAGSVIDERAIVGDQAQIRERARIGAHSVVGRASTVDFDARIGERVLIQTGVYLTGGSVVEDDVFVGPGVQTTNDDTMGRHRAREPLRGPVLRRACRLGGGVVLVPGVEIGEEAFVAAGALVTRDVGPREVAMGVPARVVRQVEEADLLERWR